MAVRIPLVLLVLAIFWGCGQSSPAPGQSEKEGGVESKSATNLGAGQQETTQQRPDAANNKPPTDARSEALTSGCLDHNRTVEKARYSPNGQKIVLESRPILSGPASANASASAGADGYSEVCVVDADGTGMTSLTNNYSWNAWSPVWSPDGEKIGFITRRYRGGRWRSSFAIMNADGSSKIFIPGTGANGTSPRPLDWSPDGENIVYAEGCDLYMIRLDGSATTKKLTSSNGDRCFESPNWSPNGKKVAFVKSGDVYLMNVFGEGDKTHWRKLIDDRTAVNYPAWSPDSTEIAVNKIEKGTEAIYKVDIDGSNETRLDTGFLPTWSPNGHHIAYTTSSDTENPGNLYMMNPDGSDPTLLVSSD